MYWNYFLKPFLLFCAAAAVVDWIGNRIYKDFAWYGGDEYYTLWVLEIGNHDFILWQSKTK